MTYDPQKGRGYGHVTVLKFCRLPWCSASRVFVSDRWAILVSVIIMRTDRQIDRQTNRHSNKQTNKQTYRKADRKLAATPGAKKQQHIILYYRYYQNSPVSRKATSSVGLKGARLRTDVCAPKRDKNSSGDEIANVNFLRRYGKYVLQNTKKENLLRLTN